MSTKIRYIYQDKVLRELSLDSKNPNLVPTSSATIKIDGISYRKDEETWNFDAERRNSPCTFKSLDINIYLMRIV